MAKEFVKGNTYVFSSKKYKKDCRKNKFKIRDWHKQVNGQEVSVEYFYGAKVGKLGFVVNPDWCKCIKVGIDNE